MKHIFYFFGIIFIIYEFTRIINPKYYIKQTKLYVELNKQFKGKKWEEYSQEYKDMFWQKAIPAFILITYLFGGLLTFNWSIFVFIIIWNLTISLICHPFRYNFIYKTITWLNSIIGFIIGIFIIINAYHLKLNVYEIIMNFIKTL